MKKLELKLISELMKNSRRSDRELAKAIGTSQPTVSRLIKKLQKEGCLKEYTVIPDFRKLGYSILAITFLKLKGNIDPNEMDKIRDVVHERMKKTPYDIIMLERGKGLGYDGALISLHEN
jgi:DNA-binding Lrp family transcriptional regulator